MVRAEWFKVAACACVSYQMPQMCGGGGRPAAAGCYSFCNYCHTDRPLHGLSLGFQGGERDIWSSVALSGFVREDWRPFAGRKRMGTCSGQDRTKAFFLQQGMSILH